MNPTHPSTQPAQKAASSRLFAGMLLLTILLGTVEGIYGRVRYSADAINYLNIVRAIHGGDWSLALNPYWGLGYPLILSVITPLFPSTPTGEWVAIHVVNLAILIAAFFAFFALVRTLSRLTPFAEIMQNPGRKSFVLLGAFAVFLSIALSMDNVSRVGPDMLVTCLLFVSVSLLLQLTQKPAMAPALTLGAALGLGFVVKAIFLPLTLVFVGVLFLATWKKPGAFPKLLLVLAASAAFAVPYIAGLSRAAGHFTYGDAGPLNYAWNVNKLEPGGLWQGGAPYGKPIHPTKMVMDDPRVYVFDGPFPVTFAPFFNSPYYYQGYRHFFSLKAQVREAAGNLLRLLRILRTQFVLYALIVCWILRRVAGKSSPKAAGFLLSTWPLVAISLLGTLIYLLVFVEARYIASFVTMLLVLPLFFLASEDTASPNSKPNPGPSLQGKALYLTLLILCCAATLAVNQKDSDRDVVGHILHHQLFNNSDQWIAADYLRQTGALPGDKTTVLGDLVNATRSNWAYLDKLRIVGILGGSLIESQTFDLDAFWHATPERQRQILSNFQSVGAKTVFALSRPQGVTAPGWEPIPGTPFWLYRF